MARPRQRDIYAGSPDIVNLAAAYTAGIVRNHSFIDGNKRTGFVIGVPFPELDGYRLTATEEDAAQAMMELAAGRLDEQANSTFLRANAQRVKK